MKIKVSKLRKLIREAVQEEMMEEGFLDTVKRFVSGVALGAGLLFPDSASANVPSSGSSYVSDEAPDEETPFIIYDDADKPHNFYLVTYAKVEGKLYAAMETDEDDLLYLFRVTIVRGEVSFKSIENDEEWEKVKAAVEKKLQDEEDEESAQR